MWSTLVTWNDSKLGLDSFSLPETLFYTFLSGVENSTYQIMRFLQLFLKKSKNRWKIDSRVDPRLEMGRLDVFRLLFFRKIDARWGDDSRWWIFQFLAFSLAFYAILSSKRVFFASNKLWPRNTTRGRTDTCDTAFESWDLEFSNT